MVEHTKCRVENNMQAKVKGQIVSVLNSAIRQDMLGGGVEVPHILILITRRK
jgi:hypothetical protein